jgi:hypothetical protein
MHPSEEEKAIILEEQILVLWADRQLAYLVIVTHICK